MNRFRQEITAIKGDKNKKEFIKAVIMNIIILALFPYFIVPVYVYTPYYFPLSIKAAVYFVLYGIITVSLCCFLQLRDIKKGRINAEQLVLSGIFSLPFIGVLGLIPIHYLPIFSVPESSFLYWFYPLLAAANILGYVFFRLAVRKGFQPLYIISAGSVLSFILLEFVLFN